MKNYINTGTGVILTTICLSFPVAVIAHVASDQSHGIKVVKIDSRNGSPQDIHVEKTKDLIIVSGIIKRKSPSNRRIRGHADVDLLDDKGQIIEHARSQLSTTSVKASRNRFSSFKSSFHIPTSEKFSVRVTHALNDLNHTN